jgi:hypothetical protein
VTTLLLLDGLAVVTKMPMELSTDAAFQLQEAGLLWDRQRPRRPVVGTKSRKELLVYLYSKTLLILTAKVGYVITRFRD